MSIQHGVTAFPSEGTSRSITLLGKDNYAAWSCKVKSALLVAKLWDLVSRVRVKPIIPVAISNAENTAIANQASIDTTTASLDKHNDAYNATASLIINTISDAQMYYVKSVIEDPMATWKRLKNKIGRKTKVAVDVAQLQFLHFQHIETKTADQTIERFENVLETCQQQGVLASDQLQQCCWPDQTIATCHSRKSISTSRQNQTWTPFLPLCEMMTMTTRRIMQVQLQAHQ